MLLLDARPEAVRSRLERLLPANTLSLPVLMCNFMAQA